MSIFVNMSGMNKSNSTPDERLGFINCCLHNQQRYGVKLSVFLQSGKYTGKEALRYSAADNTIYQTDFHNLVVHPKNYKEVMIAIECAQNPQIECDTCNACGYKERIKNQTQTQ